jgi:RNA polymerase sigma-70 factor (ECF subfamily)
MTTIKLGVLLLAGIIGTTVAISGQSPAPAEPPPAPNKEAPPAPMKEPKEDSKADAVKLESASPVVVKTVPEAGTSDVDPKLSEITVKFSKEMEDGSWSWATLSEESFPKVDGKPKYLADKRTCVLPVKLEPGKTYAIWVNSEKFGNFKDSDGRSAVPYLLVFKTKK